MGTEIFSFPSPTRSYSASSSVLWSTSQDLEMCARKSSVQPHQSMFPPIEPCLQACCYIVAVSLTGD
jgi:hypothetical protein